MDTIKVLFVCIHNSARSQMAEALLKQVGGSRFKVESAGLVPGTLNPLAVEALKPLGIDISGHGTQGVSDLLREGRTFDYVVTVCDGAAAEKCPSFPGRGRRLHWDFPDPSRFEGSPEERLRRTLEVRDRIRAAIDSFVKGVETPSPPGPSAGAFRDPLGGSDR